MNPTDVRTDVFSTFDINTAKTVKYVDEAVEGSWQDFLKSRELY